MILSFGDGAEEVFEEAVAAIKVGYIVALLAEGQEVPASQDWVPGIDVVFLGTYADGVMYGDIDLDGDRVNTVTSYRRWEDIARVHVY